MKRLAFAIAAAFAATAHTGVAVLLGQSALCGGGFPTTVTGTIHKFRMREISIAELSLSAADSVRTA